jgi:hypothetical protein
MAFLPLHLISLLSVGSVGFFQIFKRQGDYTMARAGCKGKCQSAGRPAGANADRRASCGGAAVGQRGRSEADIRSSARPQAARAPDSAEADGCCAADRRARPRLPRVRAAGGSVCSTGGGKRGGATGRAGGRAGSIIEGKHGRLYARIVFETKKKPENGPNGKDFPCAARPAVVRLVHPGGRAAVEERRATARKYVDGR